MALEADSVDVRRYRRPWYWLAVLFLAAVAATALILGNARARNAQNRAEFDANQTVRLQLVEQRAAEYFNDATQLAATGAALLGQPNGDRALARQLVLGMYRSHRNRSIYGLGVFYSPYAFDGRVRFLSFYDHAARPLPPGYGVDTTGPYDRFLAGGVKEIDYDSSSDARPLDYTKRTWYRVALAHPDEVVFEGPYFDEGRSFISTLSVVKHAGRVIGVVSIDALTPEFRALIAQPLAPGDIVSIESAVREQDRLLGTAPLPADTSSLIDQSVPLRFTHSKVHIFSDGSAVRASDKRTWLDAVSASALVWVFAGMFGAGLMRNWRANEARLRLEGEQAQLEREIGVRKKVETELRRAAYTDALTGLPNRAAFMEAASDVLARRSAGAGHAVFFIDLDRFNMINDTLGHLAGDEVLKLIAARLQATLPHDALITRLGGDEFVVIAPVGADGAGEFAASIVRCLQEPMLLAGRACYTAASVGVVLVDAAYAGPEDLLRDADIAMYRAKEAGRARFVIFDATMRNKVLADSDLENSLRRGIERGEFVPFYQPIVSIETREVTSFEALVRWNRPGSGIVGAADFIAYAEARGLIEAIDSDVFRNVCADARSLFARFPSATIAVNISAAHLTTPGLAAEIAAALAAHGIPADRMKLEITETAIMSNAEQARATLDELHDSGMQLLVDDFGAGHSSLSYLHRLPIAGLKIDRSFVTELESGRQSVAIVRSIVALAQTLGLYTVAEGVENEAQLEILRDLGVVFAQGYFFSPALSLAALLDVPGEAKRYG